MQNICHGFDVLFLQVWSCWLRQRPEGAASTGGSALLTLVTVVAMTMLPMCSLAYIAMSIFLLTRCAQFQNVLGCDEEEEENVD